MLEIAYNELHSNAQLKIAEHLINTSITREMQKQYSTEVKKKFKKRKKINFTDLLHKTILSLL